MRVIAIQTFTAFENGQMVVINKGETGEISDRLAEEYIEAGIAEPAGDEIPAASPAKPSRKPKGKAKSAASAEPEAAPEPEPEPAADEAAAPPTDSAP